MNRMIRIGLIPLLSISSLACKEILMMRYGIRQPGVETPESIRKFMDKMEYPNENTFIFKDSFAFYTCLRDSIFQHNTPGTLCFSPNGRLTSSKDASRCQWPGDYFVRNVHRDTLYQADTGYSLRKLMTLLVPLNNATLVDTANANYIVLVTWATFLGKYNERLFSIRSAIRENIDVTVKPVFLCIDIQKDWGMTKKERNALQFE